jgi:hypothetical protein
VIEFSLKYLRVQLFLSACGLRHATIVVVQTVQARRTTATA